MTESATNAVLAVYPNRSYTDAAVTYLKRLESEGEIGFDGLAVVVNDVNGRISAEEVASSGTKGGAAGGAAIGAAIGLVFPPSILGAAAVGAGIGGLAGRLTGNSGHGSGLRQLAERLEPGHAGIIVFADDGHVEPLMEKLTGYKALHRIRVDAETLSPLDGEEAAPPAEA